MADVYVGSQVDWGMVFKSYPETASFLAYAERIRARPAYRDANAFAYKLIADMQANA
jgi:glutathione S-transferase